MENPEDREKWLKITRIIQRPRINPMEIMGVNSQQAVIHLEEHNPGNMHYHCEPCNDFESRSHTTHTSHSTGHKYAFHIRKRTVPYMLGLSHGHQQAQQQASAQKLLIFDKNLCFFPDNYMLFSESLLTRLIKCCIWQRGSNISL